MMKLKILLLALLLPVAASGADLREKIAQLLIVGFRGTQLTDDNHIVRDISELGIAGVVFFDYDVPARKPVRNVESPAQLKQLIADLKALTDNTLIVSIDQEGGRVDRLRSRYGFPPTVSAAALGRIDNADTTRRHAAQMAATLREAGVNVDFAPCVDLDVNPDCPVIGAVERSYSADPQVVVRHAAIVLDELAKAGVVGCPKHFPGHGSSTVDTHLAAADVTRTWREEELQPYRALFERGGVQMVMTSHIFNARLDPVNPATMSRAITTDLLREQLGFQGVIVTDDLAMGAMVDNYAFEDIVAGALNAGADLLCLSNNGGRYDRDIAPRTIALIERLVADGRVPASRIDEAWERVQKLKKNLK
jgi:beta-N-acetylhexosaminidase